MKVQRNFLLSLLLVLPSLILAFAPTPFGTSTITRFPVTSGASRPQIQPTLLSRRYQSNDDDTVASPTNPRDNMHPALQLLGKTTSTVVAGTFFVVLAYQRDALMVSFFIGSISNGILSKVLKKLIGEERPMEDYGSGDGSSLLEPPPPSDNGMPSSHAMSLGFIGTFTALYFGNPLVSLGLLAYASISLWYRIESKLHTWEQVAVGATVGTTNAVLWRAICFGTSQPFQVNPPQDLPVHFMNLVSSNLLNDQGLLPLWGLAVPALLGAVIVGSVERRIGRFLKLKRKEKEAMTKEA